MSERIRQIVQSKDIYDGLKLSSDVLADDAFFFTNIEKELDYREQRAASNRRFKRVEALGASVRKLEEKEYRKVCNLGL